MPVDIKRLGRISALGAGHRMLGTRKSQYARRVEGRLTRLTGHEYLHVMIADYSRLACAEILDELTANCAIAFLRRSHLARRAERLIQTPLNERAHARIYGCSTERAAALNLYRDRYNYRRPHGSLNHQPPATRLNNVVGNYT